jgi:hypothetical protein|nr:MAG TPA: hypothetical protein [Caudoviricetes sp.]
MMKKNVQLWVAVFLCFCGMVLLFCGFWVAPIGEIHNSVLVAYGEISAFAGSVFGIDYVRSTAFKRGLNDIEKKLKDKEEEKNE